MKYFKYCHFIASLFVTAHMLVAVPTDEAEVLLVIEEYVELNNPNTLDDLSESELADVKGFNKKYNELSNELGKQETFYFIELSNRIQQPHLTYLGFVVEVPKLYLEHYEEYDLNEKRIIGEYIWKHHQLGDLSVNSLRKVNLPEVVRYLKNELAIEGGTNTGRGYKIWKILDEIGALSAPLSSPAPEVVKAVEGVTQSETENKERTEVAPVEVAEETPEQSSQWWLWLVGALVVVGGLGLALRRKS